MPRRTETSSIEVGSSATMTCGLTASARAMLMRWRWPPESSCGYLASKNVRIEFGRGEQFLDGGGALWAIQLWLVEAQRAFECGSGCVGLRRGEGVLNHHLHRARDRHLAPGIGLAEGRAT